MHSPVIFETTGCTQLSACSCHLYTNHELEGRKKGWNLRVVKNQRRCAKVFPYDFGEDLRSNDSLQNRFFRLWSISVGPSLLIFYLQGHITNVQHNLAYVGLGFQGNRGGCISPWRLTHGQLDLKDIEAQKQRSLVT